VSGDQVVARHRSHRRERGRVYRPSGRRSRLADIPARAQGLLWDERLHEDDRHQGDGRKTYEASLRLGATFAAKERTIVFTRRRAPRRVPPGVEFVNEPIGPFVSRLRRQPGKDIWLMGGGEVIASFLDADAVDEFVVSVVPVFIGDGIPLIERRHRHLPLRLRGVESFKDGLVQMRYSVGNGGG
jgi:dihydrofolate reductase